jgi:hypothetical protein
MHNLIDLYESWPKPEEAQKWRAKLLQMEATAQQGGTTQFAFSLLYVLRHLLDTLL